ncbi:MAG: hypothetical protein WC761_01355 [Candidatus Paceibacterota bacterium]|jgi:hypothetical protein
MTYSIDYIYAQEGVDLPKVGTIWELQAGCETPDDYKENPCAVKVLEALEDANWNFQSGETSFPKGTVVMIVQHYRLRWFICLIEEALYAVHITYLAKRKPA